MDGFVKRQRRRVGVPQFLGKIFDILEVSIIVILKNEEFPEIISWVEDGDRFVIKDWKEFQETV